MLARIFFKVQKTNNKVILINILVYSSSLFVNVILIIIMMYVYA